jgi:hypothetical protein
LLALGFDGKFAFFHGDFSVLIVPFSVNHEPGTPPPTAETATPSSI